MSDTPQKAAFRMYCQEAKILTGTLTIAPEKVKLLTDVSLDLEYKEPLSGCAIDTKDGRSHRVVGSKEEVTKALQKIDPSFGTKPPTRSRSRSGKLEEETADISTKE